MSLFLEWLKEHLLTCPSKHLLHFDCPGCGLQRSIIALIEGDLSQSLRLYPATVPLLFTLVFTALHLKFKFRDGASVIKWSFMLTISIVTIFYLYKVFTLNFI
jgi:hypothetical protein